MTLDEPSSGLDAEAQLAKGTIIEQGDHETLMAAADGTYARLFSLQVRGYAESTHE